MTTKDDLKYVQVNHDYVCKDEGNEFILNKLEILMLIEKKNKDWWICTKDDGNNNYNKPFFVPANHLIELAKAADDDDDYDYDHDYVNAVISDLDDIINKAYADEEIAEYDDEINYVNNNNNNLPQQQQQEPPKIKERKIQNKDYVKEHEEKERQRLQQYLNSNSAADTPEPDYDIHDYVNVENLNLAAKQEIVIEPPDYTDNEADEGVVDTDPYDISKEYDQNKAIMGEPRIPSGWMFAEDRYKRKFYYNEIDREKTKVN
jgi:hypothetical protein